MGSDNPYLAKALELRRQWLADNGPCKRCGSWHDLQVHHRDPRDKVSHRVWTWRADRRDEELKKCDPICRGCHVIMHAIQARKPHGLGGYRRGCRCETCRAAIAPQIARQRARRQAVADARLAATGSRRAEHAYRDRWEVAHEDE